MARQVPGNLGGFISANLHSIQSFVWTASPVRSELTHAPPRGFVFDAGQVRAPQFDHPMYIPPAFRVEDAAKIAAFIRQYSFATFITNDGGAPFASHLPMLFRPDGGPHGTLLSHLAWANPQWKHFESGREALAIFHGPHSYISPSWYKAELAVPTWNYAVVHAYGVPKVFSDHERIVSLLRELVAAYESSFEQPWPGDLPDEYRDKMIQGIVAFEIPISRVECKFKFGQNRSAEDIHGVIDALVRSTDAESQALAKMMLAECNVSR
jgi:transcriptional regulator